jgi:hypothetical protein
MIFRVPKSQVKSTRAVLPLSDVSIALFSAELFEFIEAGGAVPDMSDG